MPEHVHVTSDDLNNLLNQAIDRTEQDIIYANNIRFQVSNNDVTLDLYHIAPDPGRMPDGVQVTRVSRVVIPVSAAKTFAGSLQAAMVDWEATFGVALPIAPTREVNSEDQD
jgi:hypothetical protein